MSTVAIKSTPAATSPPPDSSALREQTARILKQVLPLMAKHCLSLDPAAYALWFEYTLAPANSPLRKAIDEVVRRGLVLSPAQAAALARAHCALFKAQPLPQRTGAPGDADAEQAGLSAAAGLDALDAGTIEGFERILDDLMAETTTMMNHSQVYGTALESVVRTMVPSMASAAAARGEMHNLQEQTDQMRQRLSQLEKMLAKSQADVCTLRAETARAKREALLDALTGLPNRRAFDTHLMTLLDKARSDQSLQEIGLLIIDLDHFKATNDRFGHPFGDKVLTSVGKLLASRLPANTYPARLGGEEFGVIVHETTYDDLMALAENLRSVLASGRVRRGATEEGHCVTASIGGALCDCPGETPTSLIERADKALYRAKDSGRNRCEFEPFARPQTGLIHARADQPVHAEA